MAGQHLRSNPKPTLAVQWIGRESYTANHFAADSSSFSNSSHNQSRQRWLRAMQATPGYRPRVEQNTGQDFYTVGLDGLSFLLSQAASTQVPLVLFPGESEAPQRGPITDVTLNQQELCTRGPSLNLRIRRETIARICVVHRNTIGSRSKLMIFDRHGQRLALFSSETDYDLAWHALIGWLLLRETGLYK